MAHGWTPSPGVAGFLSALLPGLGQLCCRRWARGLAFLLPTAGIDLSLDVTGSLWTYLRTHSLPHPIGSFVAGLLLTGGVALWSILDARRTATQLAGGGRPAR